MYLLQITDGWRSRWVDSTYKGGDQGKFEVDAGKFYGDAEKDKGELTLTRGWGMDGMLSLKGRCMVYNTKGKNCKLISKNLSSG